MAKVTTPLLSFGGEGQVGKSLVFARWRGIKYARRHVIPANPRTVAQQTTRTTFATLREMWKLMPDLARAPWDSFAEGRPFLGSNKWVGENLRVVRGQPDFLNLLGSPGSKGGLPPVSVVAAATLNAGELRLTVTPPAPPAGWVLQAAVGMGFPDQNPALDFVGPLAVAEDVVGPYEVLLTGLPSATLAVASAWLRWQKPNTEIAYSVGVTVTGTPL